MGSPIRKRLGSGTMRFAAECVHFPSARDLVRFSSGMTQTWRDFGFGFDTTFFKLEGLREGPCCTVVSDGLIYSKSIRLWNKPLPAECVHFPSARDLVRFSSGMTQTWKDFGFGFDTTFFKLEGLWGGPCSIVVSDGLIYSKSIRLWNKLLCCWVCPFPKCCRSRVI